MQNSDYRTGFTSLCGPQTTLEVFTCKTATLGPDLQVCMCPIPNVWYWAHILVPIGPSPHLWFLYAKQRLVEQHKSVYGYQTSPVLLCTPTSVISTRITSFFGFQPSSVVLYMQNSNFRTRLTSLYGTQTSLVVFASKHRLLDPNNESLWVLDLTCRFVHAKQRA